MSEISKKNVYYRNIIVILLAVNSIVNNLNINHNSLLNHISFFSMILILLSGIIFNITKYNKVSHYAYFIFLLCLLFLFKFNYFSINIVSLALSFLFIPVSDVLLMYRQVILIQLVFGFLTSLIGLSPLRDSRTGVLTFGFVNENGTGMLLAVLALTLFFTQKKNKLVLNFKWSNSLFLILILCIEKFIFSDNTAILMILFFIALVPFKNHFLRSRVLHFISFIIPICLALFAFFVAYNYSYLGATWINKLNSLMTWRINMWNYYIERVPLTYFPNNLQVNSKFFWGFFDGTYIYLGIFNGLIMLTLIVLGLSLANIRLLLSKNFYLFAFMLSFEICGFSENVIINYNQCFALIFAILAYNISWLKDNYKK